MFVYDFIFTAADYAGTTARIYGRGGVEVSESPVILDASGRFSLNLEEGSYYAVTSSPRFGLNNAQTQGVLNLPASIAAGGGGSAVPTLLRGVGATLVPDEPGVNLGLIATPDMDLRTDQFELVDNTLVCLAAGLYEVNLFASCRLDGGVTTPGVIEIKTWISVNNEDKGPAWDYYPVISTWVEESAQRLGCCSVTFPQPFDVGDVIAIGTSAHLVGSAEVASGPFHDALSLSIKPIDH
ncbi:hypothetical protein EFK50_07920 [Nocardioides marmoriginsengisoli]|uniref:Uncharacterized protein n=1 Tax=Nocardioides marmoriginsengisoli TaxID=661483 RepID=A0A3N0CK57_9ACTN|nr:hypothetical protein [Nocardioides marmoriginsengisoli]RNL63661.1 hypothetical protein EFK50_07920 [Nocardioides marmoriginsengisoli]